MEHANMTKELRRCILKEEAAHGVRLLHARRMCNALLRGGATEQKKLNIMAMHGGKFQVEADRDISVLNLKNETKKPKTLKTKHIL